MKNFSALFRMMSKQFLSSWLNFILVILLLVLFIISTQSGIIDYKKTYDEKKEFSNLEIDIFKNIKDYNAYSFTGFKKYFMPGCSTVFFSNPAIFSQLMAKANSVVTLDIDNNCKDGNVFKGNAIFKIRFSNLVFLLGSLLALALGYLSMHYLEFKKMLTCQWHPLWLLIAIILSRIIIFSLVLLLFSGVCLALPLVQGIPFTTIDYANFFTAFIPMVNMLTFFFVIGTMAAVINWGIFGVSLAIAVWIFSIFGYPAIIYSIIEGKSYKILSPFKVDAEKLTIANDFEKRVSKESGEYINNTVEGRRKVVEIYWNNDFKEIEKLDEEQKQQIKELIGVYNRLCRVMPTTFYLYTCGELSSRGFESYLDFYTAVQDARRKFLRFWIDQVYYHDKKVLVNFIKGDENIYYSMGRPQEGYWDGVLINLGIIIVFLIPTYWLFKKRLYPTSAKEIKELGKIDLEIEKQDINVFLIRGNHFRNFLFNLLSGNIKALKKKGFDGEVVVEGEEISREKNKRGFAYICHPHDLPGHYKVRNLLTLYARWNQVPTPELKTVLNSEILKPILDKTINKLGNERRFDVTMGLLELCRSEIILLNDIASALPTDCGVRLLEKIKAIKNRVVVIHLVNPDLAGLLSLNQDKYFDEGSNWIYMVESNSRRLKVAEALKKEEEEKKHEA